MRSASPRRRLMSSLLLTSLLLTSLLLTGCTDTTLPRAPKYLEPTQVAAEVTFAAGTMDADTELQHLKRAQSSAALLRRAWLELQLNKPQDALDSSAQVLYAANKPSSHDESFARYLRAEAFRLQGNPDRGTYDLDRARALALDPGLQRRLMPRSQPKPASGPAWGELTIEPRNRWQPLPANANNLDAMQPPRRVTIHHSAMYFRDTNPKAAAAQIARIQREHMQDRNYGDIGYHFLIDPSGRVWEGRELRYQGAHADGDNNVGNIGICLLGNFVRQQSGQGPAPRQIAAMEQLVVQMMRHYRFGGEALFCHSDFKNTACPGPRMQPIVRQFAQQLLARAPQLVASKEEDD